MKKAQPEASVVAMAAPTNDTARYNLGLGIGIDMTSGSAEEAADRALSSVARKLDKSLSVESTVNELIAEATDPMNLASLFIGKNVLFPESGQITQPTFQDGGHCISLYLFLSFFPVLSLFWLFFNRE